MGTLNLTFDASLTFLLDYGRLSQSLKLQYEEKARPKKTRNVAMGVTFFRSRDKFPFLSRNMILRDITFFVIFTHCVKFQSNIIKSFEVMAL